MNAYLTGRRYDVIKSIALFLTFVCIYFLTERYFRSTVNADFANSSLVWRSIHDNGFANTLKDWRPTPDSWYFSVYPVHFLLFWITQSDGPGVLTFATAVFSFLVAYGFFKIAEINSGVVPAILLTFSIAFMPEIMYTHGFIAHPFAHYSTNAYGVLALLIFSININKRSVWLSIISAAIMFIAISSDMWVAPSYLIPIILTEMLILLKNRKGFSHVTIYAIAFVVGYLHILPVALGIEKQSMLPVSLDGMLDNIEMLVKVLGQTLNIFLVQEQWAWYASILIWVIVICVVSVNAIKSRNQKSYIVIALLLSIAGILSSYILINNLFKIGSARYFVNIAPCALALCIIFATGLVRKISCIIALMFIVTSINSYSSGKINDHTKFDSLQRYISFLDSHDLSYGYGEFWHNSMEINWVSGGRIIIIPAAGNADHGINAVYARPQTLRHWYAKSFQEKSPKRQFIAFSTGYVCPDKEECMRKAKESYGTPDEVLNYEFITLFVYNHRLKFYR
ncbi:hypothetical protein [Lelliottia wanjuensis]|uniref:hypothetical protein n=1 Tax=Lelliottia wanjuensis TaxID=3050585 RepID=UPI00254EA1A8|nr:hypothetical protein [Lelliottia sp. V86_10]MDK9585758.1 hypothetical protein [Lelliottia sp. V86_10]